MRILLVAHTDSSAHIDPASDSVVLPRMIDSVVQFSDSSFHPDFSHQRLGYPVDAVVVDDLD